MKWTIAGLLAALMIEMVAPPPPAEACGVKLTVKSRAPRKAVARSSNPSEVLLLGRPPRRLERDLAAAGHRVEVAPTASAAKKKNYAVVIADSDKQNEARTSFTESVVMVRSNDPSTDMRSVENQVARRPTAVASGRAVVAASEDRTPIRVGGSAQDKPEPVASKPPSEPVVAPTPTPTPPARVETRVEPKAETRVDPKPEKPEKPEVVKRTADPKPDKVVVARAGVRDEVFFSLGRAEVEGTAKLTKAAKWLTANSSVNVVIEGHADPSGSPEGNLALGQQRAEWVRDFLVSAGIDTARLEVISFGDTKLKYGRHDGRNRRAAIVVKP
ncbi:MAG: OmpA family protein [Kofleriaceae bacterium]